ncbi:endospore germination permease [Paenibacillus chartarius]|uniref:Endospore germination permease n=1 Tax=Paenibacillus chartarius TaxID=747481 RepID=A0ABV6DIB1_9BACL
MIKLSDGKSGTREFGSIVLLTIGLKITDTTPTFLFRAGGNAAWMVPLLSGLIFAAAFFVLLSVLHNNPGKGVIDLIFELTGKYAGFVISFLLFVIILMVTAVNGRSYVDIVNVMVYQRTPLPVLFLLLMASACYVASRGLETIGRVAWIVLPYVYALFFLLIFIVWRTADWQHLAPVAGPGMYKLVKESVFHTSLFGEMFFLAALIPYVRTAKNFRMASVAGYGLSVLNMVLATALYIAVFDYPTVVDLAYPFQQLTRTVQIGQAFIHVESVFLFFWLISAVVHFAVYLHVIAFFFARTMRIEQFKPLIMPLTGLVVLMGMLPENISKVDIYRGMLIQGISLMYIIFPFVLWALDKWKRRRIA